MPRFFFHHEVDPADHAHAMDQFFNAIGLSITDPSFRGLGGGLVLNTPDLLRVDSGTIRGAFVYRLHGQELRVTGGLAELHEMPSRSREQVLADRRMLQLIFSGLVHRHHIHLIHWTCNPRFLEEVRRRQESGNDRFHHYLEGSHLKTQVLGAYVR